MEMVQYLSDEGAPLKELPFDEGAMLEGYRALRRARFFDERAEVLQRQGKLGVYPPFRGQEAAQVGAMLALEKSDWLVPSYRESAAALVHGLPLDYLILYWRAHPAGWRFPEGLNILPFYIPIATQLPQAVGVAHAGNPSGRELGGGRLYRRRGHLRRRLPRGAEFRRGVSTHPSCSSCKITAGPFRCRRTSRCASSGLPTRPRATGCPALWWTVTT